ncbi:hypothetical protein ACFLVF_00055 [Chloroflexota bacterium]
MRWRDIAGDERLIEILSLGYVEFEEQLAKLIEETKSQWLLVR